MLISFKDVPAVIILYIFVRRSFLIPKQTLTFQQDSIVSKQEYRLSLLIFNEMQKEIINFLKY